MGSNHSIKYNVDLVLCIDATMSMLPILNTVKKNALNLYSDITNAMAAKNKQINELRVRIIAYRDYRADGDQAMMGTEDFLSLPDQAMDLESIINSIEPMGGGDDPEDGLEALALAIKSKWNTSGDNQRHIIVVWSDDDVHPLGFNSSSGNYPSQMAKNFDELTDWWGDESFPGKMNQRAKRLLIFAPDCPGWNMVYNCWGNVQHIPSATGDGLREFEYSEILNQIVNSIGGR